MVHMQNNEMKMIGMTALVCIYVVSLPVIIITIRTPLPYVPIQNKITLIIILLHEIKYTDIFIKCTLYIHIQIHNYRELGSSTV